jgi:hypothetical protein
MSFTDLHCNGIVVTDSPFQAADMTQTEYSTAGGNPDGNAQRRKLHWLLLSHIFN